MERGYVRKMKLSGMGLKAKMSQEGILKYPPPLLLLLEGLEISLRDVSIPIEILTKQHFTLIFIYCFIK